MTRTLSIVVAWMGVPLILAAQTPATPASCTQDVNVWYNGAIRSAQEAAKLPGATTPDYGAVFAGRTDRLKQCAAKFTVEASTGADLLALAALYSQVGFDSLAMAAVNKRMRDPGLGEPERAAALVEMIRTLTKPDTVLIVRAEPYMRQLDAMSDAVILDKLAAHSALNSEYRYLDINDRIRQHSLAIIALGRHIKSTPGMSSFELLEAYTNLAEVYADLGQIDSTFKVLDQARQDHPEIPASDVDEFLGPERQRYELVGQPATELEAGHWLNAAAGTRSFSPRGKVTVIEFTAHWCIPCRNSYASMSAMADSFAVRGVQFAFATEFYGYFGARKNLDVPAELAADQEYYVGEHGIHFPVAIADRPPVPKPGERYVQEPNSGRYRVGGIPQTVIIDRHGVIRRILTGWDPGNAQRMPVLLAALLKDAPAAPSP
ncbi:MAG: hypothetical protein ACREK8_11170 [Gemmatimonadales bacterium]